MAEDVAGPPGPGAHTPRPATLQPPVAERPSTRLSAHSTESSRHRHALLKFNESGPQFVEKDLPAPAVLAREPGDITDRNDSSETSHVAVPAKRSSLTNLLGQYENPLIEGSSEATQACIDPRLHPFSTHPEIHHLGLVEDDEFHGSRLPTDRESSSYSPVAFSATGSSSDHAMFGTIQRVLPDGGVRDEVIDVSSHIHRNHPASIKVRPSIGLSYDQEIHDIRRGVSKVRPVEYLPNKEIIYDREYPLTKTESRPASRIVIWDWARQGNEAEYSSREAAHGASVSRFESNGQERTGLLGSADANVPSRHRRSSISEDSAGMQSKNTARQMQLRGVSSQPSKAPYTSAALHKSAVLPSGPSRDNRHREKPPASPPVPQGPPRQEPSPRRITRWLRELLGYGAPRRPRFTALPTRSDPKPVSQPDNRIRTNRRRAPAFCSEDSSGVDAFHSAVHDLERILNEAIQLADDAAALHHRECVGEPNTRSALPGISEVANQSLPSVHESLRSDLTDDSQGSSFVFRPTAFLGATDLPAHGCEALPLRSLIRRGLAP